MLFLENGRLNYVLYPQLPTSQISNAKLLIQHSTGGGDAVPALGGPSFSPTASPPSAHPFYAISPPRALIQSPLGTGGGDDFIIHITPLPATPAANKDEARDVFDTPSYPFFHRLDSLQDSIPSTRNLCHTISTLILTWRCATLECMPIFSVVALHSFFDQDTVVSREYCYRPCGGLGRNPQHMVTTGLAVY